MTYFRSPFALAAAVSVALCACSKDEPTPTDPTTQLPAARRTYDAGRGGVQITAIYYDQGKNREQIGVEDEWIVIETNKPTRTTGWTLNAGDNLQDYALPDSINGRLEIYTKSGPAAVQNLAVALNLGDWIWNNTDPDTAWLYDENGTVIDSLTYDAP